MAAIPAHREVAPLLSDDRPSVDGALIKAWASMKSFKPKAQGTPPDEGPGGSLAEGDAPDPPTAATNPGTAPMSRPRHRGRNAEVAFKGEKRSNKTHAATTEPEARLCKKAPGTGAMLCFMGYTLMENRHGLIVRRATRALRRWPCRTESRAGHGLSAFPRLDPETDTGRGQGP